MKLTRFFFLATIFTVTFEKIHWDVAGQIYLADICAIGFIVSFTADRLARGDDRVPRTSIVDDGLPRRVPRRVPRRLLRARHRGRRHAVREGDDEVRHPLPVPHHGRRVPRPCEPDVLLADDRLLHGRHGRQLGRTGYCSCCSRAPGRASTRRSCRRSPAARATSTSTARSRARTSTGRTRSPETRTTSGSCCSSRCSRSRPSTCASSAATGGRRRSPSRSPSCSSSS